MGRDQRRAAHGQYANGVETDVTQHRLDVVAHAVEGQAGDVALRLSSAAQVDVDDRERVGQVPDGLSVRRDRPVPDEVVDVVREEQQEVDRRPARGTRRGCGRAW